MTKIVLNSNCWSNRYVGLDLVYLLSKHPNVKIKYLCPKEYWKKLINLIKE